MKNILIIIDVQKGFTKIPQTQKTSEDIKELLEKRYFDYIFATKFYNDHNSIYKKTMNWEKLITKQETDLVDGIQDYIDEVIPKYIYSCVNASFLQRLSQVNNGVLPEKVFLAGMDTDSCVLKIAVDLFENGIIPIVLSNYCASNGGKESHEAGLKCLSRFVGKKYLVSKEIHIINDLNV